jgi:hypothetical protein
VGSERDNCGCWEEVMMGDRAPTPIVPTFARGLRVGFLDGVLECSVDVSEEEPECSIDGKDVKAEIDDSVGEEPADPDVITSSGVGDFKPSEGTK